jgi:hypothetical protein
MSMLVASRVNPWGDVSIKNEGPTRARVKESPLRARTHGAPQMSNTTTPFARTHMGHHK